MMYGDLMITLEQGLALLWLIVTFLIFGSASGKAIRERKKLDFADNILLLVVSLSISSNFIWGFIPSIYYAIFAEFPPFGVSTRIIGSMMIVGSTALLYGLGKSMQRIMKSGED